jgi:hypothetical protein
VYEQLYEFGADDTVKDAIGEGVLEVVCRHSKWPMFDYIVEKKGITLASYQQQLETVPISAKQQQMITNCERNIAQWSKTPDTKEGAHMKSMSDVWNAFRESEQKATESLLDKMRKSQSIDVAFYREYVLLDDSTKRRALELALDFNMHSHLAFFMLNGAHLGHQFSLSTDMTVETHQLFAHLWLRYPTKQNDMANRFLSRMRHWPVAYSPVLRWYMRNVQGFDILPTMKESYKYGVYHHFRAEEFYKMCSWIYDLGGLKPFRGHDSGQEKIAEMIRMILKLPEVTTVRVLERLKTLEAPIQQPKETPK